MDTPTLAIIAVIAIVVVAAAAVIYVQRRRSQDLRSRYGAEYLAAVDEAGDRRKAEAELRGREKRVKAFDLRPLSPREASDFSDRWRRVQAQFVDDPGAAVGRADELLAEVMRARGYPDGDFEQRAADLSVHHPRLVSDYRVAHDVALRHARGDAGTEDLRKAMIHYQALFEDLLAEQPQDRRPAGEPRSFTSEEVDDERIAESRDEPGRAPDDRAARDGRRGEIGGRAPRV
jgi:hypothetical protein